MSILQTTHATNKPIKILKIYLTYLFNTASAKGQLISKWNVCVIKSPIKSTFFWQISTLASKMDQIKK